ncbi:hypothetical protein [Nocardioides bruguierae]|uniref:Uncharacterized protein n=1 Tax=Nocardioides bruguierae TaxID=2945102 RepID=A0A9X2D4D6_9ACTN|nr:hypothetical protein [Nocardioides bruguierae]MCL8025831.1 hypothetical protein [Nocardioides bruguierae]MCM0618946.1 hypothetical protein [Nocardioides bruguierae]
MSETVETRPPAAVAPGGPAVWAAAAGLVLLLTAGQLAVATFVPGIDRFAGKAFGARLVAYPVLMLLVPVLWWATHRGRGWRGQPWVATTLVMVPFLIDVTGNTLDLYDTVVWWDDANHFVNWALLCGGLGLLLPRTGRAGLDVLVVAGLGAVLAIGWEVGEWWTFIRHGTELGTAYEDTLGDEVLGTLGATVAGVSIALVRRRRR